MQLSLPDTLALRLRHFRDLRDLTVRQLSQKSLVPVNVIEDIEAGLETFLSPATRQKLAKALRVRADQIKEVEKIPYPEVPEAPMAVKSGTAFLIDQLRHYPDKSHACPLCGKPVAARFFERRDLNDLPIQVIKAHCTECLFRAEYESEI